MLWTYDSPEEQTRELVLFIIKSFLELEDSFPVTEHDHEYQAKYQREHGWLEENLFTERGTPEQWKCYSYFGDGSVCLFVDWKHYLPLFHVGVWYKNNVRCDVPADQGHRTWQRLMAKCEKKGLDRKLFQAFVTFR